MDIILPAFGLFFWTLVIFLVLFFLMRKMAWKPILNALDERNTEITSRLQAAAEAEAKMKELTSNREILMKEAHAEREKIVKEALALKEKIEGEARAKAVSESDKILAQAKTQIDQEKNAAIEALRKEAGQLAFFIAEKVLKRELTDKKTATGLCRILDF